MGWIEKHLRQNFFTNSKWFSDTTLLLDSWNGIFQSISNDKIENTAMKIYKYGKWIYEIIAAEIKAQTT